MGKPNERPKGEQCRHCAAYFNPRSVKGAAHLAGCKRYNGYVNYETWAVALWLDNDRGSYDYWREQARDCACDTKDGTVASLAIRLRDEIKDGEGVPDLGASMYADLLGAALSEVDWHEIAENILSE